ncbi:MAG: hypothetical protein ACTHM9_00230 [Gemmatimonadales bacterium]
MPGTENGVDVYPGTAKPLDYPRHADRLKDYGTAIKSGSEALVTKVKLKGDHIEFQLDGGGYGTMGDETSSSVSVAPTPKTKREQNLEGELKRTTDPARRRDIKEELDDLKADREREDARNRASVAEAQEMKKANIRQRRLEGGSRFNIRYRNGIPDSALTPVGVQAALAQYVDFGTVTPTATSGTVVPIPGTGESTATAPSSGMPRKGMLLSDVDRLLGAPQKTSDRAEGKLKVSTRVYQADAGRINAEFVEGVLIRYTLISN